MEKSPGVLAVFVSQHCVPSQADYACSKAKWICLDVAADLTPGCLCPQPHTCQDIQREKQQQPTTVWQAMLSRPRATEFKNSELQGLSPVPGAGGTRYANNHSS